MFNEPNFDYEMFKLEAEIDYGLDAVFPEVKEDYCWTKTRGTSFPWYYFHRRC